jgi:hypothetical protein
MDLRKMASLAVPGIPSLTGLAGIIFGMLTIADCVRFQTKVKECDSQFQTGALAIGLGLSGIAGSIGSFITKNPWIRDSAEDLISTVLDRLETMETMEAPAPPPVISAIDPPVLTEELTKQELIDIVQRHYSIKPSSRLTKEEIISLAEGIENFAKSSGKSLV